jgi:hypothetical protein
MAKVIRLQLGRHPTGTYRRDRFVFYADTFYYAKQISDAIKNDTHILKREMEAPDEADVIDRIGGKAEPKRAKSKPKNKKGIFGKKDAEEIEE